ncbi:tRNA lysidine(34) synthetase TilS [Paenarthrobacter sp. Z7-10]|uniref:tRNA lysidine(34) synthetase TilS n=1 Tax=Paenarthrobacter sp. Z7-10 TaxID=2787635 RepID=UPI0022A9C370|nr:tRNA lysidine(34) synthetase TilS [Paenarthrobacter sp. Z7-10]MCZ2401948.1 tRNA lysidine(34) synthetase TilS [Paenarthrobacter sp. Z7-10]
MLADALGIPVSWPSSARPPDGSELILVACSGGPDSMALAAVAAFFARRGQLRVGAVVVDHQLQSGSGKVALDTAAALRGMGLDPVEISTTSVLHAGVGPEAAARYARYAALDEVAARLGAGTVLLGHTLDDQAESVLLGLARGSGTRSLAGMPKRRGIYLRPFLGLRRAETLAICAAEGLDPWYDPTNSDPVFARSRVRTRVLPFLEAELGPGIAPSLYRSARILGQDADYLDQLAAEAYSRLAEHQSGHNGQPDANETAPDSEIRLPEKALTALPDPIRQRVVALAVVALGGQQPSFERLLAADSLLQRRGSAGPVELAGKVRVYRQPRSQAVPHDPSSYGKLVFRRRDGL